VLTTAVFSIPEISRQTHLIDTTQSGEAAFALIAGILFFGFKIPNFEPVIGLVLFIKFQKT